MSTNIATDKGYKRWIVELKDKIRSAQVKAAIAVNKELLRVYWELGREILEKQQKANWGEGLIPQLSKDLSLAFPESKGFSRSNLFYIRQWYLFYSQLPESERVQQLVGQIPWGHNCVIINKCAVATEALFYVRETLKNNWSRAVLSAQIESDLYRRQGKALDNFQDALPLPQADLAKEILKSPYNFNFLTGNEAHERDLEGALVSHIQKFLLELGQGFAYLGQQFHLNVGGDDYYLDLLFYHTRLHCYVVAEIKVTEFKPEYAGKLNFYLNVVNDQLRHPEDQPTIGILLCKTPNKVTVKYALDHIGSPLGVAEYQIMKAIPTDLKGSLPTVEDLEEALTEN